jgi:hypothetical protein
MDSISPVGTRVTINYFEELRSGRGRENELISDRGCIMESREDDGDAS